MYIYLILGVDGASSGAQGLQNALGAARTETATRPLLPRRALNSPTRDCALYTAFQTYRTPPNDFSRQTCKTAPPAPKAIQ